MDEETFEVAASGPRVIVFGIDGSPASLRAAAYAVGVARRERAKLIGVYVHQNPLIPAGTLGTDPSAYRTAIETQAEIKRALQTELDLECASSGVDCKLVFREGVVASEILAIAAEEAADEIVLGASRSLKHRVFGSLGSRLARQCKWVVTIVP